MEDQVLQGKLATVDLTLLVDLDTNSKLQGLGTSDATDAKKYFGDMARHRLPFKTSTAGDRELIDMAFNKKKADDRKEWLRGFVVSSSPLSPSLLETKAHSLSVDQARNFHEPQRRSSPYRRLHQQGTYPLLDGRQYSFDPFSSRRFQTWSTQSPFRLLQT
jgi:hypothetical protein